MSDPHTIREITDPNELIEIHRKSAASLRRQVEEDRAERRALLDGDHTLDILDEMSREEAIDWLSESIQRHGAIAAQLDRLANSLEAEA